MLISVENLTKYINEKCIVRQASFSIEEHDKIALIGVNGTGKSTLLKMICNQEVFDSGNIIKKNGCKIHYLSQNPVFKETTVWEEIQRINRLNQPPLEEYEVRTVLTKLGLMDDHQLIATMSGGQKKRLSLACALLCPCDLLLLDEPTNHLNNSMVEWLENYLIRMKSALLMVTHDRYFLDTICTKMFELSSGNLYVHKGNYEVYLENKQKRSQQEEASRQKHKNLYMKELAWVRAGVQARSTKSKSRLQRFEQLRQMRFDEQEQTLSLVSTSKRLGKKTIEWKNLAYGYDAKNLFHDFSYTLLRNDRVGIIGNNGCGKTTLLDVLAGIKQPKEGVIEYGDTVSIGYFHQGDDQVDTSMRLIDYIEEVAQVITYKKQVMTASQMLEHFLFPRSMHYTTIDRLSGGERRRLYLCRILMQAPNILFLDEPTNDLDILTLEVLEDYLDDFMGAVIVVSHDRYFLDRVVDKVFVYQSDGTLRQYTGGFSDYLCKKEEEKEQKESVRKSWKQPKENRLTYMEKKELEQLPSILEMLEQDIDSLNQQMNDDGHDFTKLKELTKRRDQKEEELEQKTIRWMELEEKKEGRNEG